MACLAVVPIVAVAVHVTKYARVFAVAVPYIHRLLAGTVFAIASRIMFLAVLIRFAERVEEWTLQVR